MGEDQAPVDPTTTEPVISDTEVTQKKKKKKKKVCMMNAIQFTNSITHTFYKPYP